MLRLLRFAQDDVRGDFSGRRLRGHDKKQSVATITNHAALHKNERRGKRFYPDRQQGWGNRFGSQPDRTSVQSTPWDRRRRRPFTRIAGKSGGFSDALLQ